MTVPPGGVFHYEIEKRMHNLSRKMPVEPAQEMPEDETIIDSLVAYAIKELGIDFEKDDVSWCFDKYRSIDGNYAIQIWSEKGNIPVFKDTPSSLDVRFKNRVTVYLETNWQPVEPRWY